MSDVVFYEATAEQLEREAERLRWDASFAPDLFRGIKLCLQAVALERRAAEIRAAARRFDAQEESMDCE